MARRCHSDTFTEDIVSTNHNTERLRRLAAVTVTDAAHGVSRVLRRIVADVEAMLPAPDGVVLALPTHEGVAEADPDDRTVRLPLDGDDVGRGALSIRLEDGRELTDDDLTYLALVAARISDALAYSALGDDVAAIRNRADRIAEAGRRLMAAVSVQDVASVLAETALEVFEATTAVVGAESVPQPLAERGNTSPAALTAARVTASTGSETIDGTAPAILSIPVPLADGAEGGLTVVRDDGPDFRDDDLDFARALVTAAAMAVANLDLIDEIGRIAETDYLTGIANRWSFQESGAHKVVAALDAGKPVAVAMVDIDHFKTVNDRHGHLVGDQVIEEVANRLGQQVRDSDLVARYGGEEFVIVMPGSDQAGALLAAERMREAIASDPIETTSAAVSITVSIGIASAEPDTDTTLDALCDVADEALYRAKRAGRNRVDTGAEGGAAAA